jgi:hypothetical protein
MATESTYPTRYASFNDMPPMPGEAARARLAAEVRPFPV